MTQPKEGDLMVYWIPQVPMKAFEYPVLKLSEAAILCDALAKYDLFQYENKVKPDYNNAGGLLVYEDGEWCDWYGDNDEDFDEWMDRYLKNREEGLVC